ncbi:unnamed protein product [Cylicocyclus nassatus]|uniref:Uncharacterized protein n=1 Tax=Cylicocyclus nassatus TaxID=53992 RepID=A0AA36H8T3_CYLNA|nr:unnamed protein product [Cylicocyclus nassatus]
MNDNDYDKHFRLLICGGSGTGKATLLNCFLFEGHGSEGTTVLKLYGENIRIDVRIKDKWQPEYVSEYDAVIIVFASDNFKSFQYAMEVVRDVQDCDFLPVVLIENKIDLIDNYDFSNKDVIETAVRHARMRLYRVSAKEDFNVMHPFAYILEKLLRYRDENANVREQNPNFRLPVREGWVDRPLSTSRRNSNCAIM